MEPANYDPTHRLCNVGDTQTLKAISKAKVEFPKQEWDGVSQECKNFILTLLRRRPASRVSVAEALQNPWITENARTVARESGGEEANRI